MPRTQQKERTRAAIIDAARELSGTGAPVTMPAVAAAARVSEATAYRYFPDLTSMLGEVLEGLDSFDPEATLASVTDSDDPVERVGAVTEALARHVLTRQGAVRAMIAGTVDRPGSATSRPGLRFGLVEHALAPWVWHRPEDRERLVHDLAVIVGAEALFTLTDLVGLSEDEAIASLVDTARTITAARLGR